MATDDVRIRARKLKNLPKVSLHDHLDGGLRAQTVLELADEIDLDLPADDAKGLEAWFSDHIDGGSLEDYLEKFDATIGVMQTREGLVRVAKEFVEDLADDGVVYAEVRWAPEQHLTRGLSLDDVVDAVQEGIEEGEDARMRAARTSGWGSCSRPCARGRALGRSPSWPSRGAGAAWWDSTSPPRGRLPGVEPSCGVRLPGRAVLPHDGARRRGCGTGIHPFRSHRRSGRAPGHGVRIANDLDVVSREGEEVLVTFGDMARWVRDREVTLELSPTSNLQSGAVTAWGDTMDAHPFDLLYQLGFSVTVNVDNRLMSRTNADPRARRCWRRRSTTTSTTSRPSSSTPPPAHSSRSRSARNSSRSSPRASSADACGVARATIRF